MTRGFIGAFVDDRTFKYMLELLQLVVATTYLVVHSGSRLGLRLEFTMRSGFGHPSPAPCGFVFANTLFQGQQQAHPRSDRLGWPRIDQERRPVHHGKQSKEALDQ